MGFFRAVLLAASLGGSTVFAAGHRHLHVSASAAPASTTPTVTDARGVAPLTAQLESTQATLATPDHSDATKTRLATGTELHTATVKEFFPIIESKQSTLDVPSKAPAKTPSTPKSPQKTPDNDPPAKTPASSPQKTPDPPPEKSPNQSPDNTPDPTPDKSPDTTPQKSSSEPQEHVAVGGVTLGGTTPVSDGKNPSHDDDDPSMPGSSPDSTPPDAVHTLWVKGTPLYVGVGLPPAVVQGTTYSVGPTGAWLINGKPVHTAASTAVPHSHGAEEGSHPQSTRGPHGSGAVVPHHHPQATAMKSHAPLPGKKPGKVATGSATWDGPGLTTETGLSSNGGAAAAKLGPGLVGLGGLGLLVALM